MNALPDVLNTEKPVAIMHGGKGKPLQSMSIAEAEEFRGALDRAIKIAHEFTGKAGK